MKVLYLDTERSGYSPEQCGHTMTVGELRAFLDDFNDDERVYIRNDNGYTYGSIREDSFNEDEE